MIERGIRGARAELKWAYFSAAAVQGYTCLQDRATKTWSASGTFVPGLVDPFKLAQRPLFFVAPHRAGAWRWEVLSLTQLDGGRFTARLGAISTEGTNGITSPPPRR